MKLRSLKSLFLALFGTACFLGLNFSMCGPTGPSTPPKNPKLGDFVLIMPGWAAPAVSDVYYIYNDTITDQVLTHKIEHFVDGGDWNYIQDSVTVAGKTVTTLDTGVHQSFVRSNPNDSDRAESFVLDYMTAANAKKVFARMKPTYANPPVKIGNYDTSVVVGGINSERLWTLAHFSKYYIEVRMFRINQATPDDTLIARTNALLTKYQSLIQ